MRRLLTAAGLFGVLILAVATGQSAPPAVEADQNNDYRLTEANAPRIGEWMVLVANYGGPEGADLARQMAYKIRSQLNLPAYTFAYEDEGRKTLQQELDRENEWNQRMIDEAGASATGLRKKKVNIEEQYGVLIGAWATIKEAQEAQRAIRTKRAPEIRSLTGLPTTPMQSEYKQDDQGRLTPTNQTPLNPFTNAIVTRNPGLPKRQTTTRLDPLLKKLNEYEEYSLLNCPRRYTILLKEFSGRSIIQQGQGGADGKDTGFLAMLGIGGHKEGEGLNAVALQAHNLAAILRKMNLDAYVLHSSTSSAVTIGGFDDLKDPGVERLLHQLNQVRQQIQAQGKFDPQIFASAAEKPIAVEIPRP